MLQARLMGSCGSDSRLRFISFFNQSTDIIAIIGEIDIPILTLIVQGRSFKLMG
jgi:hypothetical protein